MTRVLQDILDSYQDEMIENLQKLICIKSVYKEASGSAPFGEGI